MKTNQHNQGCKSLAMSALITLAAIILLGSSQNALAQWTINGNDIYYNAGKVGVGTSAPGQTLDVAGPAVISGNQTPPSFTGILNVTATVTSNNDNTSGIRMRNTFIGTAQNMQGLDVVPTFAPSTNIGVARGLIAGAFFAPGPGITIGDARGGNAVTAYLDIAGAVTAGKTFELSSPIIFGALKPATQYGLRVNNQGASGIGASYGIYVDPQAGSTNTYAAVFAGGNVGIGTSTPTVPLQVQGDGRFTGNLTVDGNIAAKYQDLAEWVPATEQLPAGTVVVLDSTKSNQVIASTVSYDTRVAGVVSEQPGITLGERGANKLLVATTGRVRLRVDAARAPIHSGDLLVTSDIPGVAMKSEPVNLGGVQIHRPGTLIGKALEPLEKGSGTILVLLSLQ